jgi:hypothetical protein
MIGKTLIFVSHASADIKMVRRVRNYLEEKDTIPLLFHLVALTHAEEFWPLIEREILARNFFLYCESEAAERSQWVQRERQSVELARQRLAKRIGHIRVDGSDIDTQQLDRFLRDTFVFFRFDTADYYAAASYANAVVEAGFVVSLNILNEGAGAEEVKEDLIANIEEAKKDGWVVLFAGASVHWTRAQLRQFNKLKARRVVLVDLGGHLKGFGGPLTIIDGSQENAPIALVNALLTEQV